MGTTVKIKGKTHECGFAVKAEIQALRKALEPFARAYRVMNSLPAEFRGRISDTDGARDHLPGSWPTIADLRRASDLFPDNF